MIVEEINKSQQYTRKKPNKRDKLCLQFFDNFKILLIFTFIFYSIENDGEVLGWPVWVPSL